MAIKDIKGIILKLQHNKRNNQCSIVIAKKLFNLKRDKKYSHIKLKDYELIEDGEI